MTVSNPDEFVASLSPKIKSGEILATEAQWSRWSLTNQDRFDPIRVSQGVTMYYYRDATKPYAGKTINTSDLDPNDMYDCFKILVNNFVVALNEFSNVVVVEGDEDEDFTYSAFGTALATCNRASEESDWLVHREFGSTYSIRYVPDIENEDDNEA